MRVRYWLSAVLFFLAFAVMAAVLGAVLPDVGVWTMVLIVAMVYPVAVALDVLPPGLPGADHHLYPTELPKLRGRDAARLQAEREGRATARGPRTRLRALSNPPTLPMHPPKDPAFVNGMFAAAVLSLLAVGLAFGRYSANSAAEPKETPAMVLLAGRGPADEVAAVQPPDVAERAAPPVSQAATEVPPTPTPSPEAEQPTPTPEAPPPTATPDPITSLAETLQAGWMTGRWVVVDVVQEGPGKGQSATLTLDLKETAGKVTGQGSELTLTGTHDGAHVRVTFERPDGTGGRFEWVVQQDGTIAGTFEDTGGVRGVSVGKRQN